MLAVAHERGHPLMDVRLHDGIGTQAGDVFEIEVPAFGLPLKNPLAIAPAKTGAVAVQAL